MEHSIRLLNTRGSIAAPLIVCALLLPSPIGAADAPKPNSLPGAEVNLRAMPELQGTVRGEFLRPSAVDLLNVLRNQTGLKITLDDSVIRDRPIQGYTRYSAPAWGAMERLASNKWVLGRWRKIGDEYRLFATYDGPPPPRPPELPAELVNLAMNKSKPAAEPLPTVPEAGPPTFWQRLNLWGAGLIVVALSLLILASLLIRRGLSAKTIKEPEQRSSLPILTDHEKETEIVVPLPLEVKAKPTTVSRK